MKFFLYAQALIEGRRRNRPLFALFSFCSLGWKWWVKGKNFLYRREFLPTERVSVPVISVGNIVAGGTGKTPLVHLIAKTLSQEIPMAILTRGYRGGDEAKLLARRLPSVPVYIGKNRIASAYRAIADGAKLLLLDDGFQHRKLARDFDCLLLHPADRHDHYLPRGTLRDDPERISEATHIFSYPSGTEGIGLALGGKKLHCSAKKVGAFAAIARPEQFFQTLREMGLEIVATCELADHEPIGEKRLARFAEECRQKGAEALICTEKDWVKLSLTSPLALPVDYLEIELEVVSGIDQWQLFIEQIRQKVDNSSYYGTRSTTPKAR